jgi:hypothetical protein
MAKAQSSASRVITFFLLVVFCAIGWYIAPMFLPVYRWQHVDFAKIAAEATRNGHPTTAAQLAKVFDVEFAYVERGAGDPRPWVLLKMTPSWAEATGNEDEEGVAVRCTVIGERTGLTVSQLMLGSNNFKDRFFTAKAWRLPPGSLGKDPIRPVLLFQGGTLEHMEHGKAESLNWALKNSKEWEVDDDGYTPPGAGE